MKKILTVSIWFLIGTVAFAQQSVLNDITYQQSVVASNNSQIAQWQANIASLQSDSATRNALIAQETAENAAYVSMNAQTASGVNWDYFVTLEPQVPFSTWSKVDNGINWASIIPTLGITCGGITEANVNWTNWGKCEANGMTPGTSYGGYNTGIAAFWCGNGAIAGTC